MILESKLDLIAAMIHNQNLIQQSAVEVICLQSVKASNKTDEILSKYKRRLADAFALQRKYGEL